MVEWIIAIIGAITGSVSLGILIYKTWKERPNLTLTVESSSWYVHHPDAKFTIVSVMLRIDNKGERNTTIHSAKMYFKQNGKIYNAEKLSTLNSIVTASGTTNKSLDFHFPFKEIVIESDIANSTVILEHTHGILPVNIPIIKKSQYY